MTRNNPHIERKRRLGFAYVLATNPETFSILTKNNINLFHGTNSNALTNILKYGMQSVDELTTKGIDVSTGEKWSRIGGKRSFISFTDDIDTAMDYTSLTNQENEAFQEETFGVLIGLSSKYLKELKTCRIDSDIPEIGIMDNVPLEYIEFIAVPEEKVEFVQKMVNNKNTKVVPISIEEKFYYVDSDFGEISFDSKKAKQLVQETPELTENNYEIRERMPITKTKKNSIKTILQTIKNYFANRKIKMLPEKTSIKKVDKLKNWDLTNWDIDVETYRKESYQISQGSLEERGKNIQKESEINDK